MNPIAAQIVAAVINLLQGKPASISFTESYTIPSEVPVLGGEKFNASESVTITPE